MRTLILAALAATGVACLQPAPYTPSDPPPMIVLPEIVLFDSLVIDTTISKIDLQSAGDNYKLVITANYTATNDEKMHIRVYDENLGMWAVVSNNIAVAAGSGMKTRTYLIPKTSAWGVNIAAGRFDEAFVEVEMTSLGTPGAILKADAWVNAK